MDFVVVLLIVAVGFLALYLLKNALAKKDDQKYADERRNYMIQRTTDALQNLGREMDFVSSFDCLEQGRGYSHYKWTLSRGSQHFGYVTLELEALAKVKTFEVRPAEPELHKQIEPIREKIKDLLATN